MQPVTLLTGRTGSGKSRFIADRIKQLIDGGYKGKVYILVPDQYTMAGEKFYIGLLGDSRFSQVKVMSVKRLCREVFAHVGHLAVDYLTQGGKTALCAKALKAAAVGFEYFPSDYFDFDFVKLLVKAFSTLKNAGVDGIRLSQAAILENNGRLADIARVYIQYGMYLSEGLFDPDDNYTKLCEYLESNDLFCGEYVFADNFRTLNPREREVIKALCLQDAFVTVALPCDSLLPDDGLSLLSFVGENARRLTGILKKNGIPFREIHLQGQKRYTSSALAFSSAELFTEDAAAYYGQPDGVTLSLTADMYDETEAAASEIARLVAEDGYSYSDIVVTARDMSGYAPYLSQVFAAYGIPFFYHKKASLLHKTPVALISALMGIAVDGYTPANMVALLKTGFCDISREDEALFEVYVTKWNIRGRRYLSPFTLGIGGLSDNATEADTTALARVNAVRAYLTGLTEPFRNGCKDRTVRELSELLYRFMQAVELESKLTGMAEDYKRLGEEGLYSEQVQVYGMLSDALDELCAVAGNDKVSVSEYKDLLLSAVEAGDIGIIPTSLDEVMTGNIDKLPFMSPKCVFVLGLNDGVFPSEASPDPLLSDSESEALAKYDIEYGMTVRDRLLYDRFLAYTAFSAPSERLYVSYTRTSGGRLSPYAHELKRLFPDLHETVSPFITGTGYETRVRSESSAFSLMSRTGSPLLKEYFSGKPGYSEMLSRPVRNADAVSEQVSRKLFGDRMALSASRVNRFYQCRFSYFCRYGMTLEAPRAAKLDALESGNFLHAALEALMPALSEADSDSSLYSRVREFGEGYINKLFDKEEPPASFKGYFDQLLRKLYRLLTMFRNEWLNSDFTPQAYELKIEKGSSVIPVEIPVNGGSVSLIGKVDRVDTYDKDGHTYVRIIDYKSGSKSFDLQNVYNGMDVQMLMYLHCLTDGRKAVPAGVMYVNVNPVIVRIERGEGLAEAEEKLRKKRERSGLLLSDTEVLSAMDKSGNTYLPDISKPQNLATSEEFGELFGYIEKLLSGMGTALLQGSIEKNPVKLPGDSDEVACRYCDFAPYCEREGCKGNFIPAKGRTIFDKIKSGEGGTDGRVD